MCVWEPSVAWDPSFSWKLDGAAWLAALLAALTGSKVTRNISSGG